MLISIVVAGFSPIYPVFGACKLLSIFKRYYRIHNNPRSPQRFRIFTAIQKTTFDICENRKRGGVTVG